MREDRARAGRDGPDRPERTDDTDVEPPGDPDAPEPATVWRAGHERVATGPLRAHGTDAYNAEDEPLQAVRDRPRRATRGRPATDGIGLSSAEEGAARTGSDPDPA